VTCVHVGVLPPTHNWAKNSVKLSGQKEASPYSAASKGRIVRDASSRDASSKGRIIQGTHHQRGASSKGRIIKGAHHPRDASSKGTHRSWTRRHGIIVGCENFIFVKTKTCTFLVKLFSSLFFPLYISIPII
jgi:hypothetical protein